MDKKFKRSIALIAIGAIAVLGTGCTPASSASTSTPTGSTSTSTSTSTDTGFDWYVTYKGQEYTSDASVTVYMGDTVGVLTCAYIAETTGTFTYVSSDPSVLAVSAYGLVTPVKAGTANVTVSNGETNIVLSFTVASPAVSTGALSYASSISYDEKSRLLGALEDYAVNNYLTGLTMFSNGGYVAYNSRYTPKPREYVVGYGWGTLREGELTGALPNPISGLDASYYTIGTTALAAHANAMDASGSDVSDLAGNTQNAFYSTRLNENNDGYEWYPSLAVDSESRPVAVGADGNVSTSTNYGTTWRIHVKTDEVKYRTGAKDSSLTDAKTTAAAKYDGTSVKLEDYLTPLKVMLTSYNNMYRGAELTTGTAGFKGAAEYYNSTATKPSDDSLWNETVWNNTVGKYIKTGTDSTGDYIQFELLSPCSQFYAMYNLSSNLYSPLPAEFIKIWGAKNFGKFMTGYTPAETTISTGPYYISKYVNNDVLTLKQNNQYFHTVDTLPSGATRTVYNIKGVNYKWTGDNTNLKSWFESGSTDSFAPTKDDIAQGGDFNGESGKFGDAVSWKRYTTKGDSNFKLNLNACTEAQWSERFGTTGTVATHAKEHYWKVKPYMSNKHFLNFLSFSLDRQSICESRGMTPTQNYFSDNYLIDPESGVSYNSTEAHKAVLADRYDDMYGYNPTYAKSELDKVMQEVIVPLAESGKLATKTSGPGEGTSRNPYIVPIHMAWMNTTDSTDYADVFAGIKKAFSEEITLDYEGAYELSIVPDSVTSDYQHVYTNMKSGDFDIGFGAISGNDLDPLMFLEVLKSDNSSSFTLNWGPDTSAIDAEEPVVYDGKTWSYDSLWMAGTSAVALSTDGSIAGAKNVSTAHTISNSTIKYESVNATDSSVTYKISFKSLIEAGAAANMNISIYAGSTSNALTDAQGNALTLAGLGATAANDYVATVVLTNQLNSYDGADIYVATMSVSYEVTINGTDSTLTDEITLPTYYGVSHS